MFFGHLKYLCIRYISKLLASNIYPLYYLAIEFCYHPKIYKRKPSMNVHVISYLPRQHSLLTVKSESS